MQGHRRKAVCFTWEIQWLTLRKAPAIEKEQSQPYSRTVQNEDGAGLSPKHEVMFASGIITMVLKPQSSITVTSPMRAQIKREEPQSRILSGEIPASSWRGEGVASALEQRNGPA